MNFYVSLDHPLSDIGVFLMDLEQTILQKVRIPKKQAIAPRSIVFGIPTIAREGNLDYLRQTVHSMHEQGGIPLDQIYILHGGKDEPHSILEEMTREQQAQQLEASTSFSLVPRDEQPINIQYHFSIGHKDGTDKRVLEAFMDDPKLKEWRIQESHDFMWLMRYMLNHTNASYIGFNQDDSVWIHGLPPNITHVLNLDNDNNVNDNAHSIISLYSQSSVRDTKCFHDDSCGLVSLIFCRPVLLSFLEWMQPLWKEQPLDWTLEEFVRTNNMNITIYPSVKHIGRESSYGDGDKTRRFNVRPKDQVDYEIHEPTFPEIIHNCDETTIQPIVFGIPTLPRPNNPQYLAWTIEMMRQNCIRLDQIYVYPIYHKVSPLVANLTRQYDGMAEGSGGGSATSFHLVVPEEDAGGNNAEMDINLIEDPNYIASKYQVAREDRKKWILQDAHDFRFLAQYLLDHNTDASTPYIGFNQDDIMWDDMLPELQKVLENNDNEHSILSLHHTRRKPVLSEQEVNPSMNCYEDVDCGIRSLIFHRDTLQAFLRWMERIFRREPQQLQPLTFFLQDFAKAHGIIISAAHSITKHIGGSLSPFEEYQEIILHKQRQHLQQLRTVQHLQNDTLLGSVLSQIAQANQHANDSIPEELPEKLPEDDIVIGIPTLARDGNPAYLRQTIKSMGKYIGLDKIYVHHGKDEAHPVLQNLTIEYDRINGPTFHLVPRDTQSISIDYNVTRKANGRIVEAAMDDPERKRWRISEAHDFMWLMQHLLDTTNASYIGFNQDDALWTTPLPNLGEVLKWRHTSILSLYSHEQVNPKFKKYCFLDKFCGMVSLIFRRDALANFLAWMQPIWREGPIDWMMEDFSKDYKVKIRVLRSVKHIGVQSSFNGNGVRLGINRKEQQRYYRTHQAIIMDDVPGKCSQHHRPIVFGIPTIVRQGHPDYLTWTIESMRQNCLTLDQVFVFHGRPDLPHPALSNTTAAFARIESPSFHLVSADNTNISIVYPITRPENERVIIAAADVDDRKRFRIGETHNFMWLARYLLDNTDSPYIGFNQEDVLWNFPLPDLTTVLDEQHPITSLFTTDLGKGLCYFKRDCGFMSLIFRREALESFLAFLQPLWREEPISWLFEDYIMERNRTVRAWHLTVNHIGAQFEFEEYMLMVAGTTSHG
jgi:hypothetical protein